MSILISENNTWTANKWISFKFFEDALKFVNVESELGKKLTFLSFVSIDFLDLTDFSDINSKFSDVLNNVIEYNKEIQGADMHDPSYFQMYFDKLLELKKMFYETHGFSDNDISSNED
ncbi:hypothetical protein [uncultured Dokdonia sp.]|uniref:hypothetical protein n=1 Tax=uncultured Dokdonia sp. TaxID=575653 RepID=UPI0026034376|nr:hypothetical protein [uncultured Dokdonia sp.]